MTPPLRRLNSNNHSIVQIQGVNHLAGIANADGRKAPPPLRGPPPHASHREELLDYPTSRHSLNGESAGSFTGSSQAGTLPLTSWT